MKRDKRPASLKQGATRWARSIIWAFNALVKADITGYKDRYHWLSAISTIF
jgi:hypothetical protein